MSQQTATDAATGEPVRASDLIGVLVLTTFGWRYLGAYRSRETAQAVADEARQSGKYQRVRIN